MFAQHSQHCKHNTRNNSFFLPTSAGVLCLPQGLFNVVTIYQPWLAQGKMKAKQSILPILSKGLVVQIS